LGTAVHHGIPSIIVGRTRISVPCSQIAACGGRNIRTRNPWQDTQNQYKKALKVFHILSISEILSYFKII
jgi:hypothetical protein